MAERGIAIPDDTLFLAGEHNTTTDRITIYGVDEEDFLDVVERGEPVEDFEARLGLDRHALHAAALRFPHPATGQTVAFRAEWPEQLDGIISPPADWAPFVSER